MNYGAKRHEIYRLLMRAANVRWMVLRDRRMIRRDGRSPGGKFDFPRKAGDNGPRAGGSHREMSHRSRHSRESRR